MANWKYEGIYSGSTQIYILIFPDLNSNFDYSCLAEYYVITIFLGFPIPPSTHCKEISILTNEPF